MIQVWPHKTGTVFLRNFDKGMIDTIGATADPVHHCYFLTVNFPAGPMDIPVYFSQPEPIFKTMKFPFISINRDDFSLAMGRWMGIGQLEYRAGVSGTRAVINGVSGFYQYDQKMQAMPHDIIYTISVWDRYETPVQTILLNVLKAFNPIGRLIVYDSLNQMRSYEYYWEGSIAQLNEIIDPVTRARGYALTIRVEGELDLLDTSTEDSVSGFDIYFHPLTD